LLYFLLFAGPVANAYVSHGKTIYVKNVFLLISAETTFEDGTKTTTSDKLDYIYYFSYKYSIAPLASVFKEHMPKGKPTQSIKVTYELYDKNPDFTVGSNHRLGFNMYIDEGSRKTLDSRSTTTSYVFESRQDGVYTVYKLYERTFSAANFKAGERQGSKPSRAGQLHLRNTQARCERENPLQG
jgi:hypothetical protein